MNFFIAPYEQRTKRHCAICSYGVNGKLWVLALNAWGQHYRLLHDVTDISDVLIVSLIIKSKDCLSNYVATVYIVKIGGRKTPDFRTEFGLTLSA